MKNVLLGSLLSCATLFSTVSQADTSDYGLGVMFGTMGKGIYLRGYTSSGYLQASGLATYANDEVYDENGLVISETNVYMASAGASYGHYVFKDNKKLYDWLNYAMKVVIGGTVTKTNNAYSGFDGLMVNDLEVTAGIGFGIELFSPQEKGLMAEISIDYGTSTFDLLGLSTTVGVGFNF